MFSRRGFIRVGAAAVGSLALRPFGLLPALAQSGPDYRALVCVFLFGGNDSNNTVIPMDDANYKAYTVDSRKPGAERQRADADRHQHYRSAIRLSRQACRSRQPVLVEGARGGGQRRPAGAAADAEPNIKVSRPAIPLNLFSHSDQQLAWQTSIAQGHSPTGWAGRAADYIASQNVNSSSFPPFFSVAGNSLKESARTRSRWRWRRDNRSTDWIQQLRGIAGAFDRDQQPAHHRKRRISGAGRERYALAQHQRCRRAGLGAGEVDAAQNGVPHHQHRRAVAAGRADHSGAVVSGNDAARFSSAPWAASIRTPASSRRTIRCIRN